MCGKAPDMLELCSPALQQEHDAAAAQLVRQLLQARTQGVVCGGAELQACSRLKQTGGMVEEQLAADGATGAAAPAVTLTLAWTLPAHAGCNLRKHPPALQNAYPSPVHGPPFMSA